MLVGFYLFINVVLVIAKKIRTLIIGLETYITHDDVISSNLLLIFSKVHCVRKKVNP